MKGKILLEDGSSFKGTLYGSAKNNIGRLALSTAVVGYQEALTDPANAGKIIVFTYPLIGNYGVANKFYQSKKVWASGAIIKEKSRTYSNWQATGSFGEFIKKENLAVLSGVDTRTLAVKIREKGEMLAAIAGSGSNDRTLLRKIKSYGKEPFPRFIKDISVKRPTRIGDGRAAYIAVLDLGITNSLISQLKAAKCRVTLFPFDTRAQAILKTKPDGVIISNGPEEDSAIPGIVETVRLLLGRIPLLGISLGHEIIGLALGGSLKIIEPGHRGVNYPVKSPSSYKGEVTVQNHGYVVTDNITKKNREVVVTLRNVNDKTVERLESRKLKIISTQYIPQPSERNQASEVLTSFLEMAKGRKRRK